MKKLLCVLLASVLLVCCMAGCSVNKEGLDGKTVVATVNGDDVTADLYGFFLTQMKKQIEAQLNSNEIDDFWETAELEGKKLIETAREKALDEAVGIVLIEQQAAQQKIKLTKEEEESINTQITSIVAQLGSRDKYNEWLKDRGLTDELYRRLFKRDILLGKIIQETELSDEELLEYFNENVVRVKHILIESEDKAEEKHQQAEELLDRAKSGEDFDSLVAEFSEDPGSISQPDGYYLGKGFILGSSGSMVTEFESASLALPVDGISDIVETDYGYHIIKRYPNEQSVFEENKDQIVSLINSDKYNQLLEEWRKEAKVDVKNDLIEKM